MKPRRAPDLERYAPSSKALVLLDQRPLAIAVPLIGAPRQRAFQKNNQGQTTNNKGNLSCFNAFRSSRTHKLQQRPDITPIGCT